MVECDLAKVEVAGSNPVSRSSLCKRRGVKPCRLLFLDDIESRCDDGNPRLLLDRIDRYHIEPARTIDDRIPGEIIDRHCDDSALLVACHRLRRGPELHRRLQSDLNEDDRFAILRNDVNFAMPRAVASFKNYVPAIGEFSTRDFFA